MIKNDVLMATSDRLTAAITDSMTPADLRALRKRLGLTQPQLGTILDLHWSRISVYERGHAPIPMAVAIALRHLAECPAPRK